MNFRPTTAKTSSTSRFASLSDAKNAFADMPFGDVVARIRQSGPDGWIIAIQGLIDTVLTVDDAGATVFAGTAIGMRQCRTIEEVRDEVVNV